MKMKLPGWAVDNRTSVFQEVADYVDMPVARRFEILDALCREAAEALEGSSSSRPSSPGAPHSREAPSRRSPASAVTQPDAEPMSEGALRLGLRLAAAWDRLVSDFAPPRAP